MWKFFVAFTLCVGMIAGGAARAENNCTGATYYDADTDTCVACPGGYDYNTDSGKTDITQCQVHCDAGTWSGEYTQLDYIESTGTQWIEVQYFANPNTKVYADFQLTNLSQRNKFIFLGGWNPLCFAAMFGYNGQFAYCAWDDGTTNDLVYSNQSADLNRHQFIISAQNKLESWPMIDFKLKTNRNKTVADLNASASTTQRFFLFGYNSEDKRVSMKLYSFKIWDNDSLVRDFIPVRRNSDGAIGMYDKVTNTFFTNSGTGEFIAGPVVGALGGECMNVGAGYWAAASTVNFGSVGTKNACPAGTYSNNPNATSINDCAPCAGATYNDTIAASACKSCPNGYDYNTDPSKTSVTQCQIHCDVGAYIENEYTQLEYLESTGTQYIDTGIVADNTTEAEVDFMDFVGSSYLFFTTNGSWSSRNFGIIINDYLRFYMNCDGSTTYTRPSGTNVSGNIKLLTTGIFLNDTQLSINRGQIPSSTAFTTTYPIVLFGGNMAGTPSSAATVKIRYFKLWKNHELVRDFIPVRRNSDGAIGMYDKVTNTFFTNAGTGEFIAGADVGVIGVGCKNVGAGYWAAASTVNFGSFGVRTACPAGTTTVGYGHGADSANDCGRVLHIGDYVLYARRDRVTSPSLNIRIPEEGIIYYINLGSENHDLSRLHLMLDGVQYTAYDDSLYYGERDFDTGEQITQ